MNRFAWINARTISEAAGAASSTVAHAMTLSPETMDHGETVIVKANGVDILDRHTGRMVNPDLEHYKLAGPRETPAIDVVILENYQGNSATDAYGIAEPANIATAPAIANAVYNAIGVRLRSLPMTPAAILAALGKIPEMRS